MPINPPVEQDSVHVSPGRLQLTVVAACCFCAGGLYGWSALIPVVESLFTQSTQLAGLVFSTAIVCFTLSVLLVPRLPASCRDISGCVLFGTLGSIAVFLASLCTTYLNFVLAFSVGFGASSGAVYINALSVAAGYGTMASAIPTLTRSLFPAALFARRFSVIFTAWGVAGLLSPWIAGAIFDDTGSFGGAIMVALIATLVSASSALLLRFRLNAA